MLRTYIHADETDKMRGSILVDKRNDFPHGKVVQIVIQAVHGVMNTVSQLRSTAYSLNNFFIFVLICGRTVNPTFLDQYC